MPTLQIEKWTHPQSQIRISTRAYLIIRAHILCQQNLSPQNPLIYFLESGCILPPSSPNFQSRCLWRELFCMWVLTLHAHLPRWSVWSYNCTYWQNTPGRYLLLDAWCTNLVHDGRWDKDKDFPKVGSELVGSVHVRACMRACVGVCPGESSFSSQEHRSVIQLT